MHRPSTEHERSIEVAAAEIEAEQRVAVKRILREVEHVAVCSACYKRMTPQTRELQPRTPRKSFERCPACFGYGDVHPERLDALLVVDVHGSVADPSCRRADLIRGMTAGPYRRSRRLVEMEVWSSGDRTQVNAGLVWSEVETTRYVTQRQLDKQGVLDALAEQGQVKYARHARLRLYPGLSAMRKHGRGFTWKRCGVGCVVKHTPSGISVVEEGGLTWQDNRHNAETKLAHVLGMARGAFRPLRGRVDRRGDRYCDAVLGPERAGKPLGLPKWLTEPMPGDVVEAPAVVDALAIAAQE